MKLHFKKPAYTVYMAKIRARGRVETELVPVPVHKIEADAQLIYDLGIRLYSFLMSHGLDASLPPGNRPRGHKSKAARKARRKAMGK